MYLIVVLGDPERPSTDNIRFEDAPAASQALETLRTSEKTVVEFENERGEVLAVRRSAVLKAWTSETVPETNEVYIELPHLIARLGDPIYDGPKGTGWRVDREGRWAVGPSGRVVMWSCSNGDTTSLNMCLADITSTGLAIYWPCKFHQNQSGQT